MNQQVKKIADTAIGLLLLSGCGGGFYYLYKTRKPVKKTVYVKPIESLDTDKKPKNGKYLMEYHDTVYIIHLQIDSVYYDKDAPDGDYE